ncbi:type III-B CRISPR module-associated Cmr3 family protein [Tautonia plasticadhaerens]|uniref:CRISPR-associated protein (Cas_Cmr3) n=1 Tax=Tautonia plasticadhaerens TaxID=2527974 RepID=A0A518GYM3_9BACT|nr:type III-B CRISPR module-associated Cmr3 family protein [Tautonia plasticadhaerens]QDV33700.1 CRISPR-associated protein (Cas_Cmr3) [Tautonia plasticadhaerens]
MTPRDRVRIGLGIEALDLLFFRGGRPFGPATRAEGGLPQPQTLAGALRTAALAAHGFDFAGWSRRVRDSTRGEGDLAGLLEEFGAPPGLVGSLFRGPWLMEEGVGSEPTPLWSMPANLYRTEGGRWSRSDPLPEAPPGWESRPSARRPLWRRGDRSAKRPEGFLRPAGMTTYLRGGVPTDADWVRPAELYDFDSRTGLEIDPETLAGAEGRLYATRMLALRRHVSFYAEVLPPAAHADAVRRLLGGPFPWGGEGRYAVARVLDRCVDWPDGGDAEGLPLRVLASPGLYRVAGLPDRIAEEHLVAVASGRAFAVSGWDVARNAPRPTRFAAPAGAAYFLDGDAPEDGSSSLCTDPDLVAEGWGFALKGAWRHA